MEQSPDRLRFELGQPGLFDDARGVFHAQSVEIGAAVVRNPSVPKRAHLRTELSAANMQDLSEAM